MQATACSFKAGTTPRAAARPARRAPVTCALGVREAAKGAAAAAASLALVLGGVAMPAEAAKPEPSTFEQRASYEQELLEALRARGKELPELKAAPEGAVVEKAAVAPLKLSGFEKTTLEVPAEVPAPAPPAPATAVPPKAFNPADVPKPVEPTPAAAEAPAAPKPAAVAPKPAAAPTFGASSAPAAPAFGSSSPAAAGDNKGLVAGAAVATVAIAAVVASGAKGDLGEAATGVPSAASGAAAPAAGGSSGVPPNVAEARAWIAAWKAKQGK